GGDRARRVRGAGALGDALAGRPEGPRGPGIASDPDGPGRLAGGHRRRGVLLGARLVADDGPGRGGRWGSDNVSRLPFRARFAALVNRRETKTGNKLLTMANAAAHAAFLAAHLTAT